MVSRSVVEWLAELGGIARRGTLLHLTSRREVDAALRAGDIVRDGRGHYALTDVDRAVRVAAQLGGVLSHTSAALRHGWAVISPPERPHVTVNRSRRLGSRVVPAQVHFADLEPGQIEDGATAPFITLTQCLRTLPHPEALAVADSALRESGCAQMLAQVADLARGPGAPRIREVARQASGLAANPFESALRSICLSVPGLDVRPQVTVRDGEFAARADLVDTRLRIVCEADSFAWHGSRTALASDARRYNQMVIAGWIVLRFTYEDVMFHPEETRRVLMAAVALAELLAEVGPRRGPAA